MRSSHKLTGSSDGLNFPFGLFTEELCSDNDGLGWKESLSKYLKVSSLSHIDDWNFILVLSIM